MATISVTNITPTFVMRYQRPEQYDPGGCVAYLLTDVNFLTSLVFVLVETEFEMASVIGNLYCRLRLYLSILSRTQAISTGKHSHNYTTGELPYYCYR